LEGGEGKDEGTEEARVGTGGSHSPNKNLPLHHYTDALTDDYFVLSGCTRLTDRHTGRKAIAVAYSVLKTR